MKTTLSSRRRKEAGHSKVPAILPSPGNFHPPQVPVMVLGRGGVLTIGQYLRIVRHAQQHPSATFPRSFTGWWSVDGHEILRQFRRGMMDRINIRGGLRIMPEPKLARIHRRLVRTFRDECRWCGRPMDRYEPRHNRFCEASCKRLYLS